MLHKYKIFFRFESGVLIHPFDKDGLTIEAHDAKDAMIQASVEIDEINRRQNMIAGDRWCFTKVIALPDEESEP